MTTHQPCTAARHGTALAYQVNKCRCPRAREAYRLYRKRLRENRHTWAYVPALGTARRLQALSAIGWSSVELARRLDMQRARVGQWRAHTRDRVTRRTEQRIAALYEQLWDQPGPSRYTRRRAAGYGWAPPLAWDDIDDPNAEPQTGPARTGSGRQPAICLDDVDHLTSFGYDINRIADRLGVEPESIQQARRRAARREAA